MITENTVLILGAGASQHFLFPSGTDLLNLILGLLNKKQEGYEDLVTLFNEREVEKFRTALESCGRESIDEFLQHRREFSSIGKACISICLIPKENLSSIRNIDRKDNWYLILRKAMDAPVEKFHLNKISFITFNYDRTLEQFLFSSIKSSYGLDDFKAAQILRAFEIIHIHGSLGKHPYLNDSAIKYFNEKDTNLAYYNNPRFVSNHQIGLVQGNDYYRDFRSEVIYNNIDLCSKSIKIIHDEENSFELNYAQILLKEASRIIFLGFGYNETNLDRLNIKEIQCKEIYGTAYGMSPLQIRRISHLTNGKLPIKNLKLNTICDFLKHDILLDYVQPSRVVKSRLI